MRTLEQAISSADLRDEIFALAAVHDEDQLPAAVRWAIVRFFGYDRSHGITERTMYNVTVWTDKGLWADLKKVNQVWVHFLDTELHMPGRNATDFDATPDTLPNPAVDAIGGFFNGMKEGVGNVLSGGESLYKNLLWIVPVGIGLYLFAPSIRKIIIKG